MSPKETERMKGYLIQIDTVNVEGYAETYGIVEFLDGALEQISLSYINLKEWEDA